jgi:hypothetical protein
MRSAKHTHILFDKDGEPTKKKIGHYGKWTNLPKKKRSKARRARSTRKLKRVKRVRKSLRAGSGKAKGDIYLWSGTHTTF